MSHGASTEPVRRRLPLWVPGLVLLLTEVQLAVGAFVPDLERFEDKAFGARLAFYPLMMITVPAIWWLHAGRTRHDRPAPRGAFTLIMLPFLFDTTGNSLDLVDSVDWWDDAMHFIRRSTELDTAYEDTLIDLAMGTLGGFVAACFVARRVARET